MRAMSTGAVSEKPKNPARVREALAASLKVR